MSASLLETDHRRHPKRFAWPESEFKRSVRQGKFDRDSSTQITSDAEIKLIMQVVTWVRSA